MKSEGCDLLKVEVIFIKDKMGFLGGPETSRGFWGSRTFCCFALLLSLSNTFLSTNSTYFLYTSIRTILIIYILSLGYFTTRSAAAI